VPAAGRGLGQDALDDRLLLGLALLAPREADFLFGSSIIV
jgi:hypothetical protein